MEKMFELLLRTFPEELIVHGAIQGCFDTTLIAKNSKNVIGVQKWDNHSGNADCGDYLTGHHWGVLGIVGFIKNRFICFLITVRLITGKLEKCQWKCDENGNAEPLKIWDVAYGQVAQLQRWSTKQGQVLRIVADAYFAKNPFIQPLIDDGIDVITKLRADGVAKLDPDPADQKPRGRKRKYGKKIKVKEVWDLFARQVISVRVYGKVQTVEVVVADLWMLNLSKKVRAVVFRGSKGKLMLLISTNIYLTAAQIIEIYSSRYSIELAIRDAKQHLGFEDYQHHSLFPVLRFLHLVGIAYNIGNIVLLKHSKNTWLNTSSDMGDTPWTSETSFSKLRYCLRKYTLGKLVFGNSAQHAELQEKDLDKDAIVDFAT